MRSRPQTFWFTGLSGSGKSTLARHLERVVKESAAYCCVLDGDAVRQGLCSDLGYAADDRYQNVRRVAEVAKLLNEAGVYAIVALISPYRADREMAREIVGRVRFREIHVSTPVQACAERDTKGLYALAYAGRIKDFTGVSAPYELPFAPALTIDTQVSSTTACKALLETFFASELNLSPADRNLRERSTSNA